MQQEPLVVQSIRHFKEQLLAREADQMAAMARRWLQVEAALDARISLLAEEMAERKANGLKATKGQLFRMERYQELLAQTRREMDAYQEYAQGVISGGQYQLAVEGLQQAQLAIDASYPYRMVGDFKRLPVSAVEGMAGLAGDGSPLRSLLKQSYPDAVGGMTEALVKGTALGWNPRMTARVMKEGLSDGLNRVLTIARTEQLRVFRESSRMQYQASGVVDGYKRIAAHNSRTCAACLALDGKWYPVSEPLPDHPNGRCALVPCVKGVKRPTWQSGEDWLKGQPEEVQRSILGKGHYEGWKAGEFTLQDMAKVRHSATWGDSVGVRPLRELVTD